MSCGMYQYTFVVCFSIFRKEIIQKIVKHGSHSNKDLHGRGSSAKNLLSRIVHSVDNLTHLGGEAASASADKMPMSPTQAYDEERKGLLRGSLEISSPVINSPPSSTEAKMQTGSFVEGVAKHMAIAASYLHHACKASLSAIISWLSDSQAVLLGREQGGRALPALHTQARLRSVWITPEFTIV